MKFRNLNSFHSDKVNSHFLVVNIFILADILLALNDKKSNILIFPNNLSTKQLRLNLTISY